MVDFKICPGAIHCEGCAGNAELIALRAERDRLLHALDGQAEIEAGFESARGLLAQRDALRAERDKWMADHARQYSIAAAYAVDRDALRARVAELEQRSEEAFRARVSAMETALQFRVAELERLGNAMADSAIGVDEAIAWRKAVRG